jgi:prevent-host-death family protein
VLSFANSDIPAASLRAAEGGGTEVKMSASPQIVPISDFRIRQAEVLTRLHRGPVFLAQRSKPAAVLLSMEEWDRLQSELQRLRRMAEADRQFAEIRAGNYTDLDTLLTQRNGA